MACTCPGLLELGCHTTHRKLGEGWLPDVATASKGVYIVSEDRNDLENTNNGNFRCLSPLGGCVTTASICNYLTEHDALWHDTSKEWKEGSGRVNSEKKEILNRERNRAYDSVFEELRKERKVTASMVVM